MALTKNAYMPVFTTAVGKILKSRGITSARRSFVELVSKGTWIARYLFKGGQPLPDEVFTVSAAGKLTWKAAEKL